MRKRLYDGSNGMAPASKLTSMIDVVFLLLVFFLCATKFPAPEGILKTNLPRVGAHEVREPTFDLGEVRLAIELEGGGCYCERIDPASLSATRFPSRTERDFQTGREEAVPDWRAVREHLAAANAYYQEHGTDPDGLPVVLEFSGTVPGKHVVPAIDICADLGITNIRVKMPETPIR